MVHTLACRNIQVLIAWPSGQNVVLSKETVLYFDLLQDTFLLIVAYRLSFCLTGNTVTGNDQLVNAVTEEITTCSKNLMKYSATSLI
jgi:hypothetical protein